MKNKKEEMMIKFSDILKEEFALTEEVKPKAYAPKKRVTPFKNAEEVYDTIASDILAKEKKELDKLFKGEYDGNVHEKLRKLINKYEERYRTEAEGIAESIVHNLREGPLGKAAKRGDYKDFKKAYDYLGKAMFNYSLMAEAAFLLPGQIIERIRKVYGK